MNVMASRRLLFGLTGSFARLHPESRKAAQTTASRSPKPFAFFMVMYTFLSYRSAVSLRPASFHHTL